MGISFGHRDSIAGYPASIFKKALSSYFRTNDPKRLIDLRSVVGGRRNGAIVYEECLDRDLICPESGAATDQGMVILRAKSAARTPLAKARQTLAELLDRIDALNSDPDALTLVDQLWLFGSLMRAEPTVGDFDLAITRSRHKRFAENFDGQIEESRRLVDQYADAPQS